MIWPTDFARVLIVGNSGAGKSHLAMRLAVRLACPAHGLDAIHWQPGGYDKPREPEVMVGLLHGIIEGETWIVEGVYGGLAALATPRATLFLWLDLPVEECIRNLRQRGEAANAALLDWAAGYPMRDTPSSYLGHQRLFGAFERPKARLRTRRACDELRVAG